VKRLDEQSVRSRFTIAFLRKQQTAMKIKASRKPVPILAEMADALRKWREETPYSADTDLGLR
jgi:hypothetical protein